MKKYVAPFMAMIVLAVTMQAQSLPSCYPCAGSSGNTIVNQGLDAINSGIETVISVERKIGQAIADGWTVLTGTWYFFSSMPGGSNSGTPSGDDPFYCPECETHNDN